MERKGFGREKVSKAGKKHKVKRKRQTSEKCSDRCEKDAC